jgi:hypothetical protein
VQEFSIDEQEEEEEEENHVETPVKVTRAKRSKKCVLTPTVVAK